MKFEWDAVKSRRCAVVRGFDFEYAAEIFSDPARLVFEDARKEHGMSVVRMSIDFRDENRALGGYIDEARVAAQTDEDIARFIEEDKHELQKEGGHYIRQIRRRLNLSQREFANTFSVSINTIRNWEQGKRSPTGAACALLRILDKAPEASLEAIRSWPPLTRDR